MKFRCFWSMWNLKWLFCIFNFFFYFFIFSLILYYLKIKIKQLGPHHTTPSHWYPPPQRVSSFMPHSLSLPLSTVTLGSHPLSPSRSGTKFQDSSFCQHLNQTIQQKSKCQQKQHMINFEWIHIKLLRVLVLSLIKTQRDDKNRRGTNLIHESTLNQSKISKTKIKNQADVTLQRDKIPCVLYHHLHLILASIMNN